MMSRSPLHPNRAGEPGSSRTQASRQSKKRSLKNAGHGSLRPGGEESYVYPNNLPDSGPDPGSAALRRRYQQELILLATLLLAQSLPRKRFFGPAFFSGLHIEAMLLYFLNDVFLLYFALKTAQRILKRLTLLNDDFCQCISPQFRFGLAAMQSLWT